ncbi:LacI family transcriptional regulator [Actinoplanes cyaneus]|uniref:LacI family transcriptional regulator n=1 Tax=Actinoplanes cyaneus TaxID=52696 RepID=A0A919IA98_9ACTN|nr:LacI family DNA-binding transcriptional regulator [Actinoplanes cyaneus]MCW2143543.1 LacI family transcriptional regulator [Actinoplanes cyaneus]GID62370.1 LacI family transcriptional regulator [Actinoplanes cyaneus]
MPHPARPTVTLHDVARAAGVSLATASRVLGASTRKVAAEYRSRVLAAAAELNYTPDLSARAMRGRTDTVALVADDLTTPSIGMVVAAMERQARTVGAFVSVAQTRGVPERQFETVRTLCAFRPRALVLTSTRVEGTARNVRLIEELRAYERNGGRVVIYGSVDLPFDSVRFDDRTSARLVGEHLAATGHRKILILAGTPDRAFAASRHAGFVAGLAGGDIDTAECEVSRQGGYDAVMTALDTGRLDGVDAIVAVNDVVAIGALSACRDAGIAVPGRLSVTGFDDVPLASDVTPRLATLALPHAASGARAVEMALADVVPGRAPIREVVVGTFLARESCAPRP